MPAALVLSLNWISLAGGPANKIETNAMAQRRISPLSFINLSGRERFLQIVRGLPSLLGSLFMRKELSIGVGLSTSTSISSSEMEVRSRIRRLQFHGLFERWNR